MEEEAADEAIVACLARIEAASARLLQLECRAAALHSQPSPTSAEKTQSPSEGKLELTSGSLSAQEASSSTPPLSKRKRIPTPRKAGAAESSDLASSSSKSVGVGLKEYSLMVCEKVLARGTTTYNEVADSLVQDFMAGNVRGACDGEIDEKNIRRRVYDALNVLEACGAIAKDSKSVRWVSWPRGPPAGPAASSATGVAEQQQECADQQAAEVRERMADLKVGRGVQSTILYGEPDRRLAHIELSSTPPGTLPYLLLDDEMVMQRMGLGTSLPDLPEEGYGRGPQRQLDQPLASPWLRGVPKAEAGDETASPQAPPLESLDLEPLAPQAVLEAPWYYARGLEERAFGHPPPGS
ncbi:Transcription factor Dp [Auxenochlorella protothecoides]|uniref:Transcription factor Dp n=2 Tax=Auxenochlorella protothecoides TaxID=3075 RepID=A0A087STY8_AUXPR|nr:Transcription factor Dp [Auxenochlorella protothecoides]KFM29192.1 Transcription factor Dp [Auxenochlorella protothecoides]